MQGFHFRKLYMSREMWRKTQQNNLGPQSKVKELSSWWTDHFYYNWQVAGTEWEKVLPFFKKWEKWVTAVKECWSFEPTVSCP